MSDSNSNQKTDSTSPTSNNDSQQNSSPSFLTLTKEEELKLRELQTVVENIIEDDLSVSKKDSKTGYECLPLDQQQVNPRVDVFWTDEGTGIEIATHYDPNELDNIALDRAMSSVFALIRAQVHGSLLASKIDVYGEYVGISIENGKRPMRLTFDNDERPAFTEEDEKRFKSMIYRRLNSIFEKIYIDGLPHYDDEFEFVDEIARQHHQASVCNVRNRNFELRLQFKGLDYTEELPPMKGRYVSGWCLMSQTDGTDVVYECSNPPAEYGYCIAYCVWQQLATLQVSKPNQNDGTTDVVSDRNDERVRRRLLAGYNSIHGCRKQSLKAHGVKPSNVKNAKTLSRHLKLDLLSGLSVEDQLRILERHLLCNIYLFDANWKVWRRPPFEERTRENWSVPSEIRGVGKGERLHSHNVYLISIDNHCWNVNRNIGAAIIKGSINPKKRKFENFVKLEQYDWAVKERKVVKSSSQVQPIKYFTNVRFGEAGVAYKKLLMSGGNTNCASKLKVFGGIKRPLRFSTDSIVYQDVFQLLCIKGDDWKKEYESDESNKMQESGGLVSSLQKSVCRHPLLRGYDRAMSAAQFGFVNMLRRHGQPLKLIADDARYQHLYNADFGAYVRVDKPGVYESDKDFVLVEIDQRKSYGVACYQSPLLTALGITHRGFFDAPDRFTKRDASTKLTKLIPNAAFYYVRFKNDKYGLFQVRNARTRSIAYPTEGEGLYSFALIEEALEDEGRKEDGDEVGGIELYCLYTYDIIVTNSSSLQSRFNPLGPMMKEFVEAANNDDDSNGNCVDEFGRNHHTKNVLKSVISCTIGKLSGKRSYVDVFRTRSREEFYRVLSNVDYHRREVLRVGDSAAADDDNNDETNDEIDYKEFSVGKRMMEDDENIRNLYQQQIDDGVYEFVRIDENSADWIFRTPKRWKDVIYQCEYKCEGRKKLVHLHKQVLEYQKRSMYKMQRIIEDNGGEVIQVLTDAVFAKVPRKWIEEAQKTVFTPNSFSIDFFSRLDIYSTNNYVAWYEDEKRGRKGKRKKERGNNRTMTTDRSKKTIADGDIDDIQFEQVVDIDNEYYDCSVFELLDRLGDKLEWHEGGPGTGKSYSVVEEYHHSSSSSSKWLFTSFKGMAAERINGVTYHSTLLKDDFVCGGVYSSHADSIEIVVIDEISNTGEHDMYRLLKQCAKLKNLKRLILIGDMAQIAPIGQPTIDSNGELWEALRRRAKVFEYNVNRRFVGPLAAEGFALLQRMRRGILENDNVTYYRALDSFRVMMQRKVFRNRSEAVSDQQQKSMDNGDSSSSNSSIITLAYTNNDVNQINEKMTEGKEMTKFPIVRSEGSGSFTMQHFLNGNNSRRCLKHIELFEGARVIHCMNKQYYVVSDDAEQEQSEQNGEQLTRRVWLRNGSQGVVLKIVQETNETKCKQSPSSHVICKFEVGVGQGEKKDASDEEGDEAGSCSVIVKINYDKSTSPSSFSDFIHCIPLQLGYAMSIDKSQGLTFDHVRIAALPPRKEKQRVLVALSRCRDFRNLVIDEWL